LCDSAFLNRRQKKANRQSGLLAHCVNIEFTNNVSWLGDPRGHIM